MTTFFSPRFLNPNILTSDLFRAAAEAGPHHILKMYNTNGGVVNISPQLEANTRDSHYRLEVVASDLRGKLQQ